MRVERVERLLKLIHTMQSGRPYLVEDLAEVLEVNRRTVFRDLKLLRQAGVKFTFDRRTRRYHADRESSLPPVSLTHAEALSLLLATRHLLRGPVLADQRAGVSAALKVESLLPTAIQDYCGPLLERIEVRPSPSSDAGTITDTFALLQTTLALRRKIRVKYDSYYEGRAIEDILHPYHLAHVHRGWYLIAFSESASQTQTYKVERIIELKVLEGTYEVDSSFNLDDYFGNAWLMIRGDRRFHVKIRFLPKVAGNVDEIVWHKTQQTTYDSDGSLLFEVDVDGIEEISWWVLGYGDQAEVLQPPELRQLVAGRVATMHALYFSDKKR